jgi:hypothetical protein
MASDDGHPCSSIPYRLSAAEGMNGALCFGEPLRVLTPEKRGELAAIVPFEPVNLPPHTKFSVEISVRVHEGSIALSIISKDGDGGDRQIVVHRAGAWQRVRLATPPINRTGPLVIRNASASGASRAQLQILETSQISDEDLSQVRRQQGPATADPTPNGNLVIFLHLPKTAGTTLYSLLTSALKPSVGIDSDNEGETLRRFLALPQHERDMLQLAYGHMPYGLHRFVKQRCHYVVFLRHPVDRVISAYYFVKRMPEHPLHNRLKDGMTLGQFACLNENNNVQTRWLCRYDIIGILEPAKLTPWWNYREVLTEFHFQQAKECLQACCLVGFQETLGRDVLDLFRYLGLSPPDEIPRLNETSERPDVNEVDKETYEIIANHNRFDFELYQYAQGIPRRLAANAGKGERLGDGYLDAPGRAYASPPNRFNFSP